MNLDLPANLPDDAYRYGERASGETHGVVLTKDHVVRLILDLAGYRADANLSEKSLLEPSCGHGAFLIEAIPRLIKSARRRGHSISELGNAIRAYDIDPAHVSTTHESVVRTLMENGVAQADAWSLATQWVICGDYLLSAGERFYDYVVGNPPYVRIEQISPALQDEYRRRYESLFDRADLYVAFIEKSLRQLKSDGVLSFVCADRWTVNRYGAPLRKIVSEGFSVDCYVDLHKASPFESEVIAYPSIFVIRRGQVGRVHVVTLESASADECSSVLPALSGATSAPAGVRVSVYDSWFTKGEPWVITDPENLQTLRSLESKFGLLESGGTKVGIGVATGNDRVYIVDGDADIEADRLVPLVMRGDLVNGVIKDSKRFVINTFDDDGRVVSLRDYPKLEAYFESQAETVRNRHVAQKNPRSWFRTIDRVYPQLVSQPKLLIPDIAGSNEIVFDEGKYHPHHNLYFVTSPIWDMEVLGGLLGSKIALFFVWSYAVKMRGGYLRFQAQYLRRIRLPNPSSLSKSLSKSIACAFRDRNFSKLDELSLEAWQLDRLPNFEFVDTRN